MSISSFVIREVVRTCLRLLVSGKSFLPILKVLKYIIEVLLKDNWEIANSELKLFNHCSWRNKMKTAKMKLINFFDPLSKVIDSIMQTESILLELNKSVTKGSLDD
jgi:hypothetical protein